MNKRKLQLHFHEQLIKLDLNFLLAMKKSEFILVDLFSSFLWNMNFVHLGYLKYEKLNWNLSFV